MNSISTEIGDINTDIEAIQNAKRDFISDTGTKIEVGNAETLSIKGGADADSLTGNNIGVVNDGTKGFRVKLSSKLSNLDSVSTKTLTASDSITVGSGDTTTVISGDTVTTGSVTTGNTTMNNDGLTIKDGPSITQMALMRAVKLFPMLERLRIRRMPLIRVPLITRLPTSVRHESTRQSDQQAR